MSADIRPRLAKVLARLGSDHDSKRAAAGLLASRMVHDAGLTLEQLLAPATPAMRIVKFQWDPAAQSPPRPPPPPPRRPAPGFGVPGFEERAEIQNRDRAPPMPPMAPYALPTGAADRRGA